MAKRPTASKPSWTDVKAALTRADRPDLLKLIQDLYGASPENQNFLHTRFGLGGDVLAPYKKDLNRWLWPDVIRNQDVSVKKAKQVISSYKKAARDAAGLAELMVFYCECAVGFCNDVGYDDPAYFNALIGMFEDALAAGARGPRRKNLIARLDRVREAGHFGYWVGETLDELFVTYVS